MTPSRRAFVSLLGLASIGSLSGCSTESSASATPEKLESGRSPTSDQTDSKPLSTTDQTESESQPTTATHTTIPCSEWANIPDLSFSTSLSATRTVEVTITKTTGQTDTVVFEQTYPVSPDRTPETQVIFERERSEGEYTATAEVDNGWAATTDVTSVARNPPQYGILIELNDEEDAVFVSPNHSDPGPYDEPDCSRAERTATDRPETQTSS